MRVYVVDHYGGRRVIRCCRRPARLGRRPLRRGRRLGDWPPATLTATASGALIERAPASDSHSRPARSDASAVGQAESLTPADAADLLAGLLPALRDALDVLDPTSLHTDTDAVAEAGAADIDVELEDAAGGADSAGPTTAEDPERTGTTHAPRQEPVLGPGRPAEGAALEVAVLGPVRVRAAGGGEVTGLRAKVRDLLTLLAVHPDGLTSDQVSDALWPDAPPGRAARRLSPILALTRRVLRDAAHLDGDPGDDDTGEDTSGDKAGPADLVPLIDSRYRLHPVLIGTDHRRFTAALATAADARRDGDETGRRAALQAAAELYRGEPLDGVTYNWAEPIRETLRRQATDALAALADSLAPDHEPGAGPGQGPAGVTVDPVQALAALERAVEVDPYKEELYRRIMRLQATAGRRDAVRRTLRLLEARLIGLDTDPDPATLTLATDLLRPQSTRAGTGHSR